MINRRASGDAVVREAREEVRSINVARPHLPQNNLPWIGRSGASEEESVQEVEDVQGLHMVQVQSRRQALQRIRDYVNYGSDGMEQDPPVRNLDSRPNRRIAFRPASSDRIASNNGLRPNRRLEFSLPSSGELQAPANFNPGEVPLPDKKIQSLPTFNYGSEMVGKLNSGGKECPICFEEWTNKNGLIMELLCKHHYHKVCAVKNFRIRSTCPLCRKDHRN